LDTLRSKCERAYEESGTDLVLASEGSFGAHPVLAFCQADEEFLMLKDFRNDLEIVAKTISTQTNLSNKRIHNLEELLSFSHEIGFPSHALILKPLENGLDGLVKGINDESELIRVFKLLNSQYESVYAETDMRAMFNPTRMIVIEEAAHKLVEIVNSCCPECSTPGFWVSKTNSGLRCSQCGLPTKSILSLEKVCKKCDYTELVKYPNEKEYEDPTYCDICNP
jgi:hypothetical protein